MNKKQLLIFCLFAGAMGASAQNNTVAAGGVAKGAGGSATYSIGQIDYRTATGAGGSMTEGNQQPIEIFTTGLDNPSVSISASAWPNPTSNGVTLTIDDVKPGDSFYTLFDDEGKQIEEQNISSVNTSINMSALANGIYLLKVTDKNDNKTKTFKIIKNK
jgi:hypothetical protein